MIQQQATSPPEQINGCGPDEQYGRN